jgi:DNA polymerase-4/DNA polymerase V
MSINNWPRAVAHIDADYFYANCELARNPSLRGKPVMVFGRLDTCILAKTPEAKAAGIKTAIPSWEARKLCPQGVYLKGDFRYYTLVSRQMMDIFRQWSPVVEVYSVDEAFMDMDGLRGMYRKSYEQMGDAIRQEVQTRLGITVSIGVSVNKTLAKMVCELNKPNGTTVLPGKQVRAFLRETPVSEIPGIGGSRQSLLQKYRITTCQQLAEMPESMVHRLFGKTGVLLWRELNNESSFPVLSDPPPPKQIARTSSFDKCTPDLRMVEGLAFYHLERALEALHRHQLMAEEIFLYLRDKDFRTYFPSFPLTAPTDDFFTLARNLSKILATLPPGRMWRSAGISLGKLRSSKIKQLDLFEGADKVEREERVNAAKNKLNQYYGRQTVSSGSVLFLDDIKKGSGSRLPLLF